MASPKRKRKPPKPIKKLRHPADPAELAKAGPMEADAEATLFRLMGVLQGKLEEAARSGSVMVAIWNMNGDQVNLFRKTIDFPIDDFNTALDLLKNDLQNEKQRMKPSPLPGSSSN